MDQTWKPPLLPVIPVVLPATSSVTQTPSNNITATLKKSCDKENCEPSDGVTTLTDGTAANPEVKPSDFFLNEDVASDVAAVNNGAPVWIISPEEDKPKKKKNKKKKRVEKDT